MTDTPDKATLLAIAEAAEIVVMKSDATALAYADSDPDQSEEWENRARCWWNFAAALRAKAGGE